MPPSRASAIASSDSVTVSMAALTIGMLRTMFRENRERTSTSRGWRSEGRGIAVEPRRELLVPPRERKVAAGGDLDRGRGQHLQESLHAELSAGPRVESPVTPEGHRVLDDLAAVLHPDAVDARSSPDIIQPLLP